jgi:inner membrane protein
MPTILGHAAVPLAIGLAAGSRRVPPRLLLAGVAAAMLPDADVALHFLVDAPWGSPWRHRGFTHSLPFALAMGLLAALGARGLRARPAAAFAFVALACASHGLLDMLTTGGSGIPYFWPLTDQRFASPWRPIEVSPIGLGALQSPRMPAVLRSELLWIWVPAAVAALAWRLVVGRAPAPGSSRRR